MKCDICDTKFSENIFLVKYTDENSEQKQSFCCSLDCIKSITKGEGKLHVENKRGECV